MTKRRSYCASGTGICSFRGCEFCGSYKDYTVIICDACKKEIFDDAFVYMDDDRHYHQKCAQELKISGKEVNRCGS